MNPNAYDDFIHGTRLQVVGFSLAAQGIFEVRLGLAAM